MQRPCGRKKGVTQRRLKIHEDLEIGGREMDMSGINYPRKGRRMDVTVQSCADQHTRSILYPKTKGGIEQGKKPREREKVTS